MTHDVTMHGLNDDVRLSVFDPQGSHEAAGTVEATEAAVCQRMQCTASDDSGSMVKRARRMRYKLALLAEMPSCTDLKVS